MMLPDSPHRFHPSRTAWAILLATLMLAGVLALVTWGNLTREERLMEEFLRQEGTTLIRAFEAGTRSSLMTMRGGAEGALATLVRETAREQTVAYIAIVDEEGRLVAAGGHSQRSTASFPVAQALATESPLTRLTEVPGEGAVFEVAREFRPLAGLPPDSPWQRWCAPGATVKETECRRAIFVGLRAEGFLAARRQDVRQSLIIGGVLLVLGSAGLYLLFLSQGTRVARASLENMELYTRNVIESMPAGLITLDSRKHIVSSNRKALELTGREGSLEGRPLSDLSAGGDCTLAPLLEQGRPLVEEPLECRRRDGGTIPLRVSSSPIHDREGRGQGTVLILRDMRELKKMEQALEHSRHQAALGRMAAAIAHEIRNPLGTLRGFAQYFARAGVRDAQAEEYAELMVGEVDRLNRTVSALLQFARPREPRPSEVDARAMLKRCIRLVEGDIASRQLRLILDPPTAGAPPLRADPDLLTQVLLNLIHNAIAACSAGGRVTLGARTEGDIRLWVEDNGRGMNVEERERMFEPFYTTRREGTGLGLAVVQQIVEQHGGRIAVESAPGEGTRITLTLPDTK